MVALHGGCRVVDVHRLGGDAAQGGQRVVHGSQSGVEQVGGQVVGGALTGAGG